MLFSQHVTEITEVIWLEFKNGSLPAALSPFPYGLSQC